MIPEISTATDRFFSHPGPPPNSPKKEYIKKKPPGDIIILHKCTKINDNMLYCS